jgi:hypothetical protein
MDMSDSPRRLLVCLLLTAGLAACGSPTTGETPPIVASPVSSPPVVVVPSSAVPAPTTTSAEPPVTSTRASSTPTTPATQDRALPLTLSRTGGIAGVQDQVEVDPDGTATVIRRGGTPATSTLSAADLAALRRLLTDPALAREAKVTAGNGVCADGFQYTLRTPSVTMKTDDCGRSDRPTLAKIISLVLPPGGK